VIKYLFLSYDRLIVNVKAWQITTSIMTSIGGMYDLSCQNHQCAFLKKWLKERSVQPVPVS